MPMLKYEDYESVIDTIYSAGNVSLKLHCRLMTSNKNNNRQSIYKEFTYCSSKYNQPEQVTNIYRTISCYLSIGNIRSIDGVVKETIPILMQDIYYVRAQFDIIYKILLSAFQTNSNGKLELAKVYDPVILSLSGKKIEFIPVVINNENHNYQDRGVRIILDNYDNYSDISIDQFMAFKYNIDCINMYQSALSILSYMGKPDNGYNNTKGSNLDGAIKSPFK